MTRKEADANNLSSDAATRAAWIVRTFTDDDPVVFGALRLAVTSQSTRKRISLRLRRGLATALIVRALDPNVTKSVERVRRYLPDAFNDSVSGGVWKPTFRSADQLLDAALIEHRAEPDPDRNPLGPARRELATRAGYVLVATLSLLADKGTANNDQPDRRMPGLVIDRMARSEQGLRQLHRALADYADGHVIRAVGADGEFEISDATHQQVPITDRYIRYAYPAPGKVSAPGSVVTPTERLQKAVADFGVAVMALERAKGAVDSVEGRDGTPLVTSDGIQTAHVDAWRKVLGEVNDALLLWGTAYRLRMHKNGLAPQVDDESDESPESDGVDDDGTDADGDDDENAA